MYSFVNLVQIYYRRENKRRDRLFGQPMKNAVVDTSVLADEVCV